MPRRQARRIADELVVIARRLFDERRRTMETAQHDETCDIGSDAWIANMKEVLVGALARLQNPPPPSPPLEAAAHASLKSLVQIEQELKKGDAASPVVAANAGRLRALYHDRLRVLGRLDEALLRRADDDGLYAALAALDSPALQPSATRPFGAAIAAPAVPTGTVPPEPVAPPVDETAPAGAWPAAPVYQTPGAGKPFFSVVSQDYIDMRVRADGQDHPDIPYLQLRRQLFLELIGDAPVDRYNPRHLQDYVELLQFWPGHAAERSDLQGMSIRDIIESNRDHHLAPLAKKTAQDGYVANLKTMMRSGCATFGYNDPLPARVFTGRRALRHPCRARTSTTR